MDIYPYTDDPLVAALQRLLLREGGYVVVGDKAGINDQSLYQIAARKPGTKSGKPKSVGPSIRQRLSTHYPDWLDGTITSASSAAMSRPTPNLAQALAAVAAAIQALPRDRRQQLAPQLSALAAAPDSADLLEDLIAALAAAPASTPAPATVEVSEDRKAA